MLEGQLDAVAVLEDADAVKFQGRADGPEFTWKQAGGNTASSARATSASRAWRKSAIWLNYIDNATSGQCRLAACWKLFNYRHPKPDQATASDAQKAAWADFETWRKTIAEVNLDAHWTKVFKKMAEAKAEHQEGQAQMAQFLAWIDWMHEGPAGGLRKQHQFTKIKGGWVESATIGMQGVTSEEAEIEEGVSAEQLRKTLHPAAMEQQPANIQEETDQQAENWHSEWGSNLTCVQEPQWPADLGELPPRLLEDSLVQAALTFPVGTGLGWDGIHPRLLSRLWRPALRWVACILMEAERSGKWQQGIGIVIIVLIPKGDGTYRPIGLMPWLPRVWMQTRRINATVWERINSRSWIYAGVGKGADIAAWNKSARA